ncbi:MAG: excalibur calcium-binding domain-containing protein [Phyllobacteriaceae bacterium]|nr:excalibur calcium-binding domain-containing protein [Phyllobacteriaceae bacterium]
MVRGNARDRVFRFFHRYWHAMPMLAVASAFLAWGAYGVASSPFPPMTALRHLAAAPNCDAARAVGLAPARRNQPGYYSQHDRDQDGIACEPWPQ